MNIPVPEDDAHMAELIRLARNGNEVVLTERGRPSVRLVPVEEPAGTDDLAALLHALRGSAKKRFGPSAARSADFLYDDFGLPA